MSSAAVARKSARGAALTCILLSSAAVPVNAQERVWIGGPTGDINNQANWSAPLVQGGLEITRIDGNPGQDTVVSWDSNTLDVVNSLGFYTLTVEAGDAIELGRNAAAPGSIALPTFTLTNNGRVELFNRSQLTIHDEADLGDPGTPHGIFGSGEVIFNDSRLVAQGQWTVAAGQTLRGFGEVGHIHDFGFGVGDLTNLGTIVADNANEVLHVGGGLTIVRPPGQTASSITGGINNQGTLRGTGAAGLQITNTLVDNLGGLIDVQAGSRLTLEGGEDTIALNIVEYLNAGGVVGTTINGGSLINAGAVDVIGETAFGGGLNVSGAGSLSVFDAANLTIDSSVALGNDVTLLGAAADSSVTFTGNRTLDGSFAVQSFDSNFDVIMTDATLTNAAGHNLAGGGRLLNDTGSLTNLGTITADVSGVDLIIDPSALGSVNNFGQINTAGSNIQLNGGTFVNEAGGSINVAAGDVVSQNASLVTGTGAVNISAGAEYRVDFATLNQVTVNNSGTLQLAGGVTTLGDGLTVNGPGTIESADGHTTNLIGGMNNNTTFNLNGTTANTTLNVVGNQTLGGTGEVVISSVLDRIVTDGSTLTNGGDHTIRGGGILLGDTGLLINDGTVLADNAAVRLQIDPSASGVAVNNGDIRADGGDILLTGGLLSNSATGTVNIAAGNQLELSASEIIGPGSTNIAAGGELLMNFAALREGVINNDGTLRLGAGTATGLTTGLTLNGSGTVEVETGHTLFIDNGGITNNSTINVSGDAVTATSVVLNGAPTLDGTGELVLGGGLAQLTGDGLDIVNGANHTIRGGGALLGNSATMTNNGTILADNALSRLVIDASPDIGNMVNNGQISADGGNLLLTGTILQNSATGAVDVAAGSQLELLAAEIVGPGSTTVAAGSELLMNFSVLREGTVNNDGVIRLGPNTATGLTTGLTLNGSGSVEVESGHTLFIDSGGITNNSTINVNTGIGATTTVQMNGTQTLSGTGELRLSDFTNQVLTDGSIITNGADHTISGSGILINQTGGFVNDGTVISSGPQSISLITDSLGLVNNGSIIADDLITLGSAPGGITDNRGSIVARNDEVTLTGTFVNNGQFLVDANGTANLGDFTQNDGSLVVDGVVVAGQGLMIDGGTVGGSGVIGNLDTVTFDQGGTLLTPTDGDGLTFLGDVTIAPQGMLQVSLFGANPQSLAVEVQGLTTIDGILDLQLDAAFAETLAVGNLFELFSGNGFGGSGFSNINITALGFDANGFEFDTVTIGDSLFLSVNDVGVVPAAPAASLALLALCSMVWRRRRAASR